MYKNKPFKMYKIFEEIYYSKSYNSLNTYRNFETVANPYNKTMLNEYIYYTVLIKKLFIQILRYIIYHFNILL